MSRDVPFVTRRAEGFAYQIGDSFREFDEVSSPVPFSPAAPVAKASPAAGSDFALRNILIAVLTFCGCRGSLPGDASNTAH